MSTMPEWKAIDLGALERVPLGVLRSGTLRRHGVTRWQAGTTRDNVSTASVSVIDLHARLLEARWQAYAAHVLHHEYIHAAGHRPHDAAFRRWEAAWPHPGSDDASAFAACLHEERVRWWWTCQACDRRHGRLRRGNGRYACRRCGSVLVDRPAEVEER
ncbi:MAG: hypothetical protein O3B05_05905 [archaeon]|nr:hypothetical protein [archaeon]